MPIKYLCDICGADAPVTGINKIVTTVDNGDGRLLVLEIAGVWKNKRYVNDHNALKYTALLCDQCIKKSMGTTELIDPHEA